MAVTQAELQRADEVIRSVRAPKPPVAEVAGKVCPRCNGTGRLTDDKATGARMRAMREGRGLSGREVARRMGFSAAYVCDLELGRRIWSTKVIELYLTAIR
jgi:predicted transcriptional regulator